MYSSLLGSTFPLLPMGQNVYTTLSVFQRLLTVVNLPFFDSVRGRSVPWARAHQVSTEKTLLY